MNARPFTLLLLPGLVWCLAAQSGLADRPKDHEKDEAALLKNAEAFVEAFHNADAKALAALWAPEGDYIDQTGHSFKGREAIEKAFTGLFAENKGLKLRIDIAALRFVTPDVAVEDGTTEVIPPDGGPPSRARYTAVHVRKDGQWLLGSVRDAAYAPPSNHEHLRSLDWVVGEWVDDADKGEAARATFTWTDNQNFLMSTFASTFKGITIGGGTQWIGWDPLAKKIRSWTFEATGGFGEGTWTQDGDKWIIKTTTVLRDGKKLSATDVVTRTGDDTLTWEAKDRTLDGNPLPDIKPVKMKRPK